MAGTNPIQIVLNDRDFFTEPEPGRGGRPTDFFAGNDPAFIEHKRAVIGQLAEAALKMASWPGQAGVVKITLREDALAKSHRPERALFLAESQPCIGGANLGELYYLTTSQDLIATMRKVELAEETTTWVHKSETDRTLVANPSKERADTGSIFRIDIPPAEDKRDFSAEAAVQWLNQDSTGGAYLVDLFDEPAALGRQAQTLRVLRDDFDRLLGKSDIASHIKLLGRRTVALRLATPPSDVAISGELNVEQDRERHQSALDLIAAHPLVRKITLPVMAALSDAYATAHLGASADLAMRVTGARYPRVGVIDTGLAEPLADWVLGVHDFIGEDDLDPAHGTFIGGLLTSAARLNPSIPGLEADGCDLVDLPLYPRRGLFGSFYPNGFADFLDEMDSAIEDAVADHGVRIFNLSINAIQPVAAGAYSYYAERLDEIAAKHDVVIVNSAGNLDYAERRAAWPTKPRAALTYFAGRTDPDTIHQPCESHRAIAVGAINPPGSKRHLHGAPTTYTRRGPGLRVGCKPDVAHYGGGEGEGNPAGCGLESITTDGMLQSSCGTSYAAPLVAKTLATLENRIQTRLPAHALRALMIHSCGIPPVLDRAGLGDLRRQFVGFGQPATVDDMLFDDDHAITLIFSSLLPKDGLKPRSKVMRFPFRWPAALVDPITGACRGKITATLISTPPVDRRFGAEFVRINVEAAVQQRQAVNRKDGKPSYRDVLKKVFLPKDAGAAVPEKELIKQGMKWWPTKGYQRVLPAEGHGVSSEWQIEVSSLRRSQVDFPAEGIPFCLVVTISDPDRQAAVFQDMRRGLSTQLVQLGDLLTTLRVRPGGA